MTCTRIDTPHTYAADDAALSCATRASSENMLPVVLVASYDETVRLKKAWSTVAPFGIAIVTLQAWIADLWELYGDGRTLVEPVERQFLIAEALSFSCQHTPDGLLRPTAGTRKFIAAVARKALPRAVDNPDLSAGEREAIAVLATYRDLLKEHGLVEYSEAIDLLREADALAGCKPIVLGVDAGEFSALERALLASADVTFVSNEHLTAPPCDNRAAELEALSNVLFRPNEKNPVQATGAVRFVLPSGRYAVSHALCSAIEQRVEENHEIDIVIAAREPYALFEAVSKRLALQGIATSVQTAIPFSATEFGMAWLALLETFCGDTSVARAATDFAISAYAGVSVRGAYRMDVRWRANRALDRDSILTDLSGTADHGLNGLVGSLENGRMNEAFDIMQAHIIKQISWPSGYRDRQLSALSVARSVYEQAERFGADLARYRAILEDQRMGVRMETEIEPSTQQADSLDVSRAATVRIIDLSAAASLGPASCDVLFVTELTASAYAVRDGARALQSLLEKLGAPEDTDGLESLRAVFARAITVPQHQLVLSCPLKTVTADDERPAVIFEDLVDCYRADLQNPSEVDEVTGLPASLGAYADGRGEQAAFENLSDSGKPQSMEDEIPIMPTGFVTPSARSKILLPQQWGGVVCEGYCLSPSAIESYLECPYKWFAHRRLRLEELDAGFGGREFGLFAHRVLELFYARFRADVALKVTPATLEQARSVLNRIINEQLAYDASLIGDSAALVPLTDLERKEVEDLRRKLLDYLGREAVLLPGFSPLDGEVSFGRKQGTFEYAGFKVNGTIDRVDVDGFGRAVIIDYKGAVGKAYALRENVEKQSGESEASDSENHVEFILPRKVQTLIYAQAVRKTMGLEPVGAIYLSYGKDQGISGAFDHSVLDPGKDLLGIDAALCGTRDFGSLLDEVEEMVATRLSSLLAGEIPACPRDADACTYCPVTVCSVRDAVQRERGGDE